MSWREDLLQAQVLSFDIEIWDSNTLACVGFAADPAKAYVFPAATQMDAIREILATDIPKIGANVQFDVHFLLTRCGIKVNGPLHDVQLQWHSCYPELAGKRENGRNRHTRKSLSFLASLFTWDAWWKGDYETEEEFYVYNGRDVCITLDLFHTLNREIADLDVAKINGHSHRQVWPVTVMQARGLRVDNALRLDRIQQLEARKETINATLDHLALPLIQASLERLNGKRGLFETRLVCACCRNGKAKRAECWSCAGFETKPSKKALGERVLAACEKCGGKGEFFEVTFNGRSVPQKQVLLYDILGLPKRFNDGKLSTDEEAIKSLVAATV